LVVEVSGSFRDEHGGDEEWLDYARGLVPHDRRAELASHLDAGCIRCATRSQLWRETIGVAGRLREYDPPDAVVRQMKGAFALHHAAQRPSLVAALVFDSLLHPLPSGVRSAARGPRQLLYKAGRYVVRLRAEDEGAGGRTSYVGQIIDEELPGAFLADVTVLAFSGTEAIDQTLTNRLGEFAFQAAAAADEMKLAIGLAETGFLTVALPIARTDGPDRTPSPAKRLNWK
jgi:pimeloyl-ACP methyl ester carboxylesterase